MVLKSSLFQKNQLTKTMRRVRRGVAASTPSKYVLDDKELTRVAALAKIELEDARVELERAHHAAQSMGRGVEDDASGQEENENDWVECVLMSLRQIATWVAYRGFSDESDDMDVDHTEPNPKIRAAEDELAEYHLDDYDDNQEPGVFCLP